MAKHIIYVFVMLVGVINGVRGQCTASDICCATTSGNGDWTKPQGGNDAFVYCYIHGSNVISTDCPTGWTYDAGGQWPAKCKYDPFNGSTHFGSVKSCAASNSCPSVENVCNNINLTAVRAALNVVVGCTAMGSVNIPVCPIGWNSRGSTRCDKEFRSYENYNDTQPDYSAVCENPQTYNKSSIIPAYGVGCNYGIKSISYTEGCLGHINWETATYSNFANLTGTKNGMDCTTINFTSWGCCSATPTSSTQAPTTNTPTTTSANTNTTTQAPTTSTNTNTTTAASEDTLDTGAATMTARDNFVFMLLTIIGVMCWF